MFKISKQTSYKWTVQVQTPVNNSFRESSFIAEFKVIPQSRIDAITKGDDEGTDLVNEVLLGWWDVIDDDNQPVPFTPENKAAFIDDPAVRMGLVRAFFKSIAGRIPKT